MVKNATDKAGRILKKMKEQDRRKRKRWKPYSGPADWNFVVLNAPPKQVDGERDERPEVSNG